MLPAETFALFYMTFYAQFSHLYTSGQRNIIDCNFFDIY